MSSITYKLFDANSGHPFCPYGNNNQLAAGQLISWVWYELRYWLDEIQEIPNIHKLTVDDCIKFCAEQGIKVEIMEPSISEKYKLERKCHDHYHTIATFSYKNLIQWYRNKKCLSSNVPVTMKMIESYCINSKIKVTKIGTMTKCPCVCIN